jgi:hypothetical protein
MKEIITTPTIKIKTPINVMKGEKTAEKPAVNFPSTVKEMPKPTFVAKTRRKRVDATHNAKLVMTKLV